MHRILCRGGIQFPPNNYQDLRKGKFYF
ncbi:hypothetical protein B1J92_F04543g [Nakaseomyces glabratus]|nr:hypothetical protein B1J91_F04543g [Nakaseomyces glabratus]OXB49055.1 hypothetical protein B1J92_F04543g [Nakaseomyces glabratus]